MKKLLLILLCAPLMFSCGEKENNEKDTQIQELEKRIEEFEGKEEFNVIKEKIAITEANVGIVKITSSLEKKNSETYAAFEDATNQEKVKNYKNLANEIKPQALEVVGFIHEIKYDLDDKSNKNVSNEVIYNSGKATLLKDNILDFKELLLNTLETAKDSNWVTNNGKLSSLIEEINTTLDIKDGKNYGDKGKKVSWEHYNFHDMPSVGALTLLSKWQADIRNMESAVISFLASNIDASPIKFTSAEAITIPLSNFILRGDEFTSKIFLTSFDETSNPKILIGDYDLLDDGTPQWHETPNPIPVENGQGIYTVKGNRVGPQTYKGLIKILQDDGDQYYPFEGEYMVANKSFTISPTKMNIIYIGLDNPISVSVAGYQPEDIKVSFSGGVLTSVNRKKGEYIIKPSQSNIGKEVSVSVSVKKKDGKTTSIGKSVFRVKNGCEKCYH